LRDILPDLERWFAAGRPVALATVVETWGSSPRRPGAHLAVNADGEFAGSVSGGCVENAAIQAGLEALGEGGPRLLHFGVSDDVAWEIGLACGGSLDVFVRQLDAQFFHVLQSTLMNEGPARLATVIGGPSERLGRMALLAPDGLQHDGAGPLSDWQFDYSVAGSLGPEQARRLTTDDGLEILIQALDAPPSLVLVGGVHISRALAELARTVGFRTILIEPRRAWGSEERFSGVDRIIPEWPQTAFEQVKITPSTAVAVLTHDPKLDDPALIAALRSPAFYVGALGSRSTQAARRSRLLAAGLDEAQLARLHGPIGLDIRASTPEEIALAVMAEIVAARHGATAPGPPAPSLNPGSRLAEMK
jgi:xanthine dehydrogenase accessory factor